METAMAKIPNLGTIPLKHPPQLIPPLSAQVPRLPQSTKPSKQFPSYLETPNLSRGARILCEILSKYPATEIESALNATGYQPEADVVEEVLKLSYGLPAAAVEFFRWAGMKQKHSSYSWNLMVDLLGKNEMFEPMWDAIRSMKKEGSVLSVATFVSIFGSYCVVGRFSEAIMTFDVMDRYGVQPDVVAVNSLLSAICREDKQTVKALEFLERVKTKIPPDGDSFAILLEGWEKEGNVAKAKTTFGEMVIRVGWSPQYMPAYDAFLNTLIRGSQIDETMKFLLVMKGKNCLPGLKFFSNALDVVIKKNDYAHAVPLWDVMVGCGIVPNLIMYNAMIGLLCKNNDHGNAFRLLDEMALQGSFPDSLTYNMIFQSLVKNKKLRKVGKFFIEMTKNEWPPTPLNCAAAISMFLDDDDPEMAIEIWDYMVKNHVSPLDEGANALLIGLSNMGRLSDVRRFADKMLDRRVNIDEATMGKLKTAFYKEGRGAHDRYDDLLKKWRSR